MANEDFTRKPLLKFKITSKKTQFHANCLKHLAALQKLKVSRQLMVRDEKNDIIWPKKELLTCLQHHSNQIEISAVPKYMENKIRSFLPIKHVQHYKEIVEDLMKDVRKQYDQSLKKLVSGKPKASYFLQKTVYRQLDSHRINKEFLKAKRKLGESFFLGQKCVLLTLRFSVCELPTFMCSFKVLPVSRPDCPKTFQGRSTLLYSSLCGSIRRDIKEYNNFLRSTWFPELLAIIKDKIDGTKDCKRLYKCLEGLISRQIIEMKWNALLNLIKLVSSELTIPALSLKMEFYKDTIELNPSFQAIFDVYSSLACDIADLGVGMLPKLEKALNSEGIIYGDNELYIELKMNDISFAEYVADLKCSLNQIYRPLMVYIESFQTRYSSLLNNCSIKSEQNYIDFNEAFQRIHKYNEIKTMLQLETKNSFFTSAVIRNDLVLQQLSSKVDILKENILKQLTGHHINLLEQICNDFEKLQSNALKVPTSTEELLALKAFLNEIDLEPLIERINYSQHMGNQLLEVTSLSKSHLKLIVRTLNWLSEIDLVCKMSASQITHFEDIFRGHLKAVSAKLCQDLKQLLANVQLLDKIRDFTKLREHSIFIQNTFRKLNDLDNCVRWINKEEALFNIVQTRFEVLEEARERITKYIV